MIHGFFKHNEQLVRDLLIDAIIFMMTLFCIFMLSGCSTQTDSSTTDTTAAVSAEDQASGYTFTDRELDPSYDESTAVKISLNGSSAEVNGSGASASTPGGRTPQNRRTTTSPAASRRTRNSGLMIAV